ncbi:hypothetical protein [Xanthomonas arboricola]|uniref:hypothetical protein n=1 Tax=Xanthomonas arboricola TaxID=56448 RepID=UPI00160F6DBD|nr:hypothetical protein [Xanthomonas arboricola]MBB5675546.1 hypothetical protein [Xanthomonas arboricola]
MGELLDRALQRQLLETLTAAYPAGLDSRELGHLVQGNALRVNITYLAEHGLVAARFFDDMSEGPQLGSAKVTAKGIDFLADDGGLGAILGVVTIKLHEDTLLRLIESKVRDSDLPPTQKTRLLDQLRKLPAETTKHLAMKLVDAGLKHAPDALQLLQNAVS